MPFSDTNPFILLPSSEQQRRGCLFLLDDNGPDTDISPNRLFMKELGAQGYEVRFFYPEWSLLFLEEFLSDKNIQNENVGIIASNNIKLDLNNLSEQAFHNLQVRNLYTSREIIDQEQALAVVIKKIRPATSYVLWTNDPDSCKETDLDRYKIHIVDPNAYTSLVISLIEGDFGSVVNSHGARYRIEKAGAPLKMTLEKLLPIPPLQKPRQDRKLPPLR